MAAILFLDPKIPNWEYINIISKIQQHLVCEHPKWQSYKKNIANFSKMKQLASSKRVAILDFGKVENFMFFAMILAICVLKIMQNGKAVLTIWPIMYKIKDGYLAAILNDNCVNYFWFPWDFLEIIFVCWSQIFRPAPQWIFF